MPTNGPATSEGVGKGLKRIHHEGFKDFGKQFKFYARNSRKQLEGYLSREVKVLITAEKSNLVAM